MGFSGLRLRPPSLARRSPDVSSALSTSPNCTASSKRTADAKLRSRRAACDPQMDTRRSRPPHPGTPRPMLPCTKARLPCLRTSMSTACTLVFGVATASPGHNPKIGRDGQFSAAAARCALNHGHAHGREASQSP
eukprot:scaffold7342_cov269-Pinguiococcus_pyrenoidosus.AAC.1